MMISPTPSQIRESRQTAGLTQAEAAAMVHAKSYRTWQAWEYGVNPMPAAKWALWQMLIKSSQS